MGMIFQIYMFPMLNNKIFKSLFFVIGFVIGLVLFLDGLILVLYKKIHLGTILPLLIGLVFILVVVFNRKIQDFLNQHLKFKKLWCLGWFTFTLWLMSLLAFFGYIYVQAQQNLLTEPVTAIIVLGSGISQGKASPTLAKRLDKAGEVARQQPQSLIIVSGGLDYGEVKTEAEIMALYLHEHDQIAMNRILQENKSTSTELNLKNSQTLLTQNGLGLNSKIAIVTSDFHTLRAGAIAQKQGYQNFVTVGAETPLTTRYNAWLREYFAYLSGWVLGEY